MLPSEMIKALEATGDYRVLHRFQPRSVYGEIGPGRVGYACVVDFETTGVEVDDTPWEVGMVLVEYDLDSGRLGRVVERYHGLEDPGRPLPDHIKLLTGATDEELHGKTFDDAKVDAIVRRSGIMIAHNSAFDRTMAEKRFSCMATKPWGCSMDDVPWKALGLASVKLEFIAVMQGAFYDAHRAPVDAEVTTWVLGNELSDGHPAMWHVLTRARRTNYRVWALDSPFQLKDVLKARGYKWFDGPQYAFKGWRIETVDLIEELEFLETEIYGPRGQVMVEELGPKDRFTERRAGYEPVTLGQKSFAAQGQVAQR
ncbi:MAG TPA: 3'-5' exonuclease [Albitalea sp.]|nr:3'-5' exonuclease [Albitalea sp.]